MNGIEIESVLFSHQFHRHCTDNELRRDIAFIRRIDQLQQKRINWLPPLVKHRWKPPLVMSMLQLI